MINKPTNLDAHPSPRPLEWPTLLTVLQPLLIGGAPVYLVGGAVRDAFLRRPIHDLDFTTADDGRKLAKRVADKLNGAYYPLDDERGVGRAIIKYGGERFVIDISRFRGNTLADDLAGRDFTINALAVPIQPSDSDPNEGNEGNLHGAIGFQNIIDTVGGIQDLQLKQIRRCTPASLQDDPVRALRAVRQSVALNFKIETETQADIRRYGQSITSVSVERVRDEFMTMLGGSRPHLALRVLDTLGLLKLIIPEIEPMRGVTQCPPHVFDVWEHTLNVVEKLYNTLVTVSPLRTEETAADSVQGMVVYLLDRYRKRLQSHLDQPLSNGRSVQSLLILSALLHDIGKPQTRIIDENGLIHFHRHEAIGAEMTEERAIALRLSNDEVARLTNIVLHHMRPLTLYLNTPFNARENKPELSRRTIHRFWKATGEAGIDVCILILADFLGTVGVNFVLQDWIHYILIVSELLDGYFNQKETIVSPPLLLTGNDLITHFDLQPGPSIGRVLSALSEAQAAGEITTVEQALELARQILNMN